MGGGWVTEADKMTGGPGTPSEEQVAKQPLF
jgi:hypothetical protein